MASMLVSASSVVLETGASTCTTASALTGLLAPARSRPRAKLAMLTPCSPSDGADFADDAGDVEVAADEQISFERRFDVDAVELEQAGLLAVNDGGDGVALPDARMQLDGEHGGCAAAMALLLFFVDADAALLRDGGGVDAVHIFRALQQTFNRGVADQVGFGLGERAAVGEVDGSRCRLCRLARGRSRDGRRDRCTARAARILRG